MLRSPAAALGTLVPDRRSHRVAPGRMAKVSHVLSSPDFLARADRSPAGVAMATALAAARAVGVDDPVSFLTFTAGSEWEWLAARPGVTPPSLVPSELPSAPGKPDLEGGPGLPAWTWWATGSAWGSAGPPLPGALGPLSCQGVNPIALVCPGPDQWPAGCRAPLPLPALPSAAAASRVR